MLGALGYNKGALHEMDIKTLAQAVNSESSDYSVGGLQELRTTLKGFKRVPGSTIFSSQTTFDDWAFHHGGRSELQFNIGSDQVGVFSVTRYGVAFSFETSRTLPTVNVLVPKVKLFNEYVRTNLDQLSGFEMWHYQNGVRSANRMPTPISADLVDAGTFVFLGGYSPSEKVRASEVLSAFDKLLPLYHFVESGGVSAHMVAEFAFRPGNALKKSRAIGNSTERELSIDLKHNDMQETLYRELCKEFGSNNVGTERPSGTGGRIDVVSRVDNGYAFYEIKVGRSVQGIIREAVGQLLEYSLWPGAKLPTRLVIVGEPELDEAGHAYLKDLNKALPIPLLYKQLLVGYDVAQQSLAADARTSHG